MAAAEDSLSPGRTKGRAFRAVAAGAALPSHVHQPGRVVAVPRAEHRMGRAGLTVDRHLATVMTLARVASGDAHHIARRVVSAKHSALPSALRSAVARVFAAALPRAAPGLDIHHAVRLVGGAKHAHAAAGHVEERDAPAIVTPRAGLPDDVDHAIQRVLQAVHTDFGPGHAEARLTLAIVPSAAPILHVDHPRASVSQAVLSARGTLQA